MSEKSKFADAFIALLSSMTESGWFWVLVAGLLIGAFLVSRQTNGAPGGQYGWSNWIENLCLIALAMMITFWFLKPYLNLEEGGGTISSPSTNGLKNLQKDHFDDIDVDWSANKVTFPRVNLHKEYGGDVWVVCWNRDDYPPADDLFETWEDGEQVLETDSSGNPVFEFEPKAKRLRFYILKLDPKKAMTKFSKEVERP